MVGPVIYRLDVCFHRHVNSPAANPVRAVHPNQHARLAVRRPGNHHRRPIRSTAWQSSPGSFRPPAGNMIGAYPSSPLSPGWRRDHRLRLCCRRPFSVPDKGWRARSIDFCRRIASSLWIYRPVVCLLLFCGTIIEFPSDVAVLLGLFADARLRKAVRRSRSEIWLPSRGDRIACSGQK